MAIEKTAQLADGAKKWELKPATDHASEQMRDHFGYHYSVFKNKWNSMDISGIVNNAVLQAGMY